MHSYRRPLPSLILRALTLFLMPATLAAAMAAQPRLPLPIASAQGAGLEPYAMIDQWPDRDAATAGLIQDAVGLAVAMDGRIYISDRGLGGVHVMLPDGRFLPPVGGTGSGPERLAGAGDISIPPDEERFYVLDTGTQRVVVFSLDGAFVSAWGGIDGASVAAGPGGVVYVADRQKNRIVAYDRTGAERFAFGTTGTGNGEFIGITDLSVSDDGTVVAVGDYQDKRVQLFDVAPDGLRFRRAYDLERPVYHPYAAPPCLASQVAALGGDEVLVSNCHLTGPGPDEFTRHSGIAAGGTICPLNIVVLFSGRPAMGHYVALTKYDPNLGRCDWSGGLGLKQHVLPTTPAVVFYHDVDRRLLSAIHLATASNREDAGLRAPHHLSVTPAGKVLVMDRSNRLRVFAADGAPEDIVPMVDTYAEAGETTKRLFLDVAADLRGESGEVIAYYKRERQVSFLELAAVEHGAGRFRRLQTQWRGHEIEVAEPLWTTPFSPPPYIQLFGRAQCGIRGSLPRGQCAEVIDLAYSATGDAAYVLIANGPTGNPNLDLPYTGVDEDARMAVIAADSSGSRPGWDLPDAASGSSSFNPWVDLDADPDGGLWALDSIAEEAVAFDAKGTVLRRVPLRPDVKRIAGGKGGTVFGLRDVGFVERYDASGAVRARFDARPLAGSDPMTLSALDVDDRGRVFVADEQSGLVSVFAPATDGALAAPADAACRFVPTKTAAPTRLTLGDMVDVELGVAGRCGPGAETADVVIASVQLYRNPLYGRDTNEKKIKLLRQIIGRIDLSSNRIGLVSYLSTAFVEQELTADRKALERSVGTLRVGNDCGGQNKPPCAVPQVRRALQSAMSMLRDSSAARRVIVLPLPDYCSRDLAWNPSACTDYQAAEDVAREASAAGIRIVVMGDNLEYNGRYVLASSDADIVSNSEEAATRIVGYRMPDHLATNFELVDELPANMPLVAGSVSAPGTIAGRTITWRLPFIDGGEVFRLGVRPAETGRHPTNVQAIARFVDGWGQSTELVFPIPVVDVDAVPPTATPTRVPPTASPTPTPRPPTAPPTSAPTVMPSATPSGPTSVYLPIAMKGHCLDKGGVDIVLVVDASSSMSGEKLTAAKVALQRFITLLALRPGGDRAAVVAFSAQAELLTGLTSDRPALGAAVGRLATREGTRLDLGLAMARDALLAGRPTANRPVVIVLSDGRADDPAAALAEAATLAGAGVTMWAVGLGADVDATLLTAVAGDPTRYLSAPSAADLDSAYVRIAGRIPCE